MHITFLSGGLSPKQANCPTSTSQLKPPSDIVQNSRSSFPTQAKRKKREKGDHGANSIKRERSSRLDDGDSVQCKTECKLKHEITRITEKGGVVNLEGVDKLVQLMHPDRKEGKMDLVCRSMLASVLASTGKVDCLNRFVQQRGLPVLDEWLQDIHKGKIGDGKCIKDGDKSVDEFLLVLLHALDKLPVNLQALQMCNIGRSVNHLRSHKNTDIQKKARTLVDTWKKRVEAEMINIDATKSGSTQAVSAWPSKSRLPEDFHGGARTSSGSGVAMKSSITQNSAAKTTSSKSSPGDSSVKYEASSPGPVKPSSSLASGKESQPRSSVGGSADVLQIREDSSSSNQSHNHGHASSAKDSQKSSPSVSVTVDKKPISSSRIKRNSGLKAISATGSQKGTSACKSSSAHKSVVSEKFSHSALASERVAEGPINTEGSSHKLIVKMSNCVSSPAQGVSGVSLEDSTYMSSQAPSPVLLNRQEQAGHVTKHKSDASRSSVAADMKVCYINDPKDVLTVSEGSRSPAVLRNEMLSMNTYDSKGLIGRPPTNQSKLVKLHASSFSPMHALIESCARYSEATSSLSLDDDVGMNLLASVAAGEMSRSDVVSPTDSTKRSSPAVEEVCSGGEVKSRSSPDDFPREAQNLIYNDGECDGKEHAVLDWYSDDRKSAQYHSAKDKRTGESSKDFADSEWEIDEKSNEKTGTTSKAVPLSSEKIGDSESHGVHGEKTTFSHVNSVSFSKCASGGIDMLVTEQKDNIHECKPKVEVAGAKPLDEGDEKLLGSEGLNRITISDQKPISTIAESEFAERASNGKLHPTECGDKSVSESGVAVKEKEPNDSNSCTIKSEMLELGESIRRDAAAGENLCASVSCSTSHDLNSYHIEKLENLEHVSLHDSRCPDSVDHETLDGELIVSKPVSIQAYETDKCASTGARAASFSAAGATYPCTRIKLDLNEYFCVDDEKYRELVTSTSSCSTTLHMINSLSLCMSSIPSSHSASVTVASAAIRRFVPPEDLLRGKVELGLNGSAASSAFRSAETRKTAGSNLCCPDASTSKNNRFPLDIDLNVTDEGVLEEMSSQGSASAIGSTHDLTSNCDTLLNEALVSIPLHSSGGLGLDLNIIDEASDTGYCSTSSNHHGEASIVHVKPVSSLHVQKDFDLNNGPAIDDASAEQFSIKHVGKGGAASQLPSAAGCTRSSQGPSSSTSWFSPVNTYSTVGIPSGLSDRGDQPFHVFTPGAPQRAFVPADVTSFNPDMYRGSVLSSAPALPFPSSTSQFPVFPFGTTFPIPSANFPVGGTSYPDSSSGTRLFAPSINSQYLGPVGNVASQFQRPYLIGLPNISNSGGLDINQKWGRQCLDLNADPGAMESEVKEEILPYSWGQHSVANFQALAEEQARVFSVSRGSFKRKEPEGGLNKEPVRHRYSSWQ